MKILLFGDLHLGKKASNSYFLDLDCEVIKKLVECVKSEKIEKVVFLGDLFHIRNEVTTKALLKGRWVLDNLNALNIPVVMVLGNHCCFYNNTNEVNYYRAWDGLYKNITFVENLLEDKENSILYSGWIFTKEDYVKYEELSKKYSFVFGHFEFSGIPMNTQYIMENGFINNNKNSMIFSGHIHQRTFFNNVIYIGSPYPHTWIAKNRTDFGFAIVDTKTKKISFKDLGLYAFNEYGLKEIMDGIKENPEKYKKAIFNSETKIIFDEPISDKDLTNLKLKIDGFQPRNIIYETMVAEEAISDIDYQKISLGEPKDFIFEYIKDRDIQIDQKNRILSKIETILKL